MKMLISKFDTTNMEENIREFQEKYNIQLPEEYKKFLVCYNGGITVNTTFQINRVSSNIVGFYGLGNADKEFHFKQFDQMGMLREYIARGVLPIAYNDFGDKIAIGINHENTGRIYFLYHDMRKNVELATEFKEFIDKCKSEKIGHIPSIEERKKRMIENGFGDKITENSIKGWQAEINQYKNIYQEKVIL